MKKKNLIIYVIGFYNLINFEVEDNLIIKGLRTEKNFEKYKKQLDIKEQLTKIKDESKLIIASEYEIEKIKKEIYKLFFRELEHIEPKDVISDYIPCFKMQDININDIFNSPVERYIDIPKSLQEDSYQYFGVIIDYHNDYGRYYSGDVVIIRKGESFAFEHTDELFVLRNGELIFSRFTHDFEEHTNILYIQDMDDEEYLIHPEDMYIYKVIGAVMAILPRLIQDKKEKDEGLFNRRLKSLHDWKEYDEEI